MSLLLLFAGAAPWQSVLLSTATRLAQEGHHEVAVVTALMACETATERAFAHWFQKRGIPDLEESIVDFFPSYSLANDRLRALYVALSGDPIQEASFWAQFKEAARLRGQVVHGGVRVERAQADSAIEAARAFTDHIASAAR
jgi:hypothetical protein